MTTAINTHTISRLDAIIRRAQSYMQNLTGRKIQVSYTITEDEYYDSEDLKKIIINIVSKDYGIPVSILTGKSKTRNVAEARFICYKLLRDNIAPFISLKDIGILFNRDHSTVIYGLEQIQGLCSVDEDLLSRMNKIQETITLITNKNN